MSASAMQGGHNKHANVMTLCYVSVYLPVCLSVYLPACLFTCPKEASNSTTDVVTVTEC